MTSERTPLIQVVRVGSARERYPHSTLRRFCTILLSTLLILGVIGFLAPFVILCRDHVSVLSYMPWARPYPSRAWPQSDGLTYKALQRILLETPEESKSREWSKYYTSGPNLAGKNLSQALWTMERWEEFGVQSSIVAYDVYLNYPVNHRLALLESDVVSNYKDINERSVTKNGGFKVIYECTLEEDVLDTDPTTALANRVPTFHGYSASGNVTAPYVYANFGTFQDFEDLVAANISLKGKIVLAKYGRTFRGLKVKRAQELGFVGVVLYTDPQQDGEITEENGYKTYPDGPARNPSSVQRGSAQFLSIICGELHTSG